MKTIMKKRNPIFITGLLYLLIYTSLWAEEPFEFSVMPDGVSIGTYYNGTNITVSGKVPEDCEAVGVFTDAGKELHLKEKGKALGLLWMNMDTLIFKNVPSVFFVVSRKKIEEVTAQENSDVQNIGFAGLTRRITLESDKTNPQFYIEELFNLKKQEGLYQEQAGEVVSYAEPVQGYKTFRMNINLPSRLSPGSYNVNVYAVQNGLIRSHAVKPVEVGLTDIPAFLAKLAFGHSLIYGILATVIAIASGLIIGFIFQGSKGGAH